MTFYFAIIGTKDNPIYETEFGTSKQGGDGHARVSRFALHVQLEAPNSTDSSLMSNVR